MNQSGSPSRNTSALVLAFLVMLQGFLTQAVGSDPSIFRVLPEDQTIAISQAASILLLGDSLRQPLPPDITVEWSKLGGPGEVTFGTSGANYSARFSLSGTYSLQAKISNGSESALRKVSVTVENSQDRTSMVLNSETGDPIGNGAYKFEDKYSAVIGAASQDGVVKFTCAIPGQGTFEFKLRAPFHAPLRQGRYDDTELVPAYMIDSSFSPRPQISAGGWYGNGWMEIKEISYGEGDQEIRSLWALFEVRAQGLSSVFRGELKLRATQRPPSGNQRPGVYVDPSPIRCLVSEPLSLSALAADDDLPSSNLSVAWTTKTGPAQAIFSDPTALQTTASFPEGGDYTIQITASDGVYARSAEIAVKAIATDAPTRLTINSAVGDPIGKGVRKTFTELDAAFEISVSGKTGLQVRLNDFRNSQPLWQIDAQGPSDGTLQNGCQIGVISSTSFTAPQDHPTFAAVPDISAAISGGRSTFAIRDLQRNTQGEITGLWLTFTQYAPNSDAPLTGELLYYPVGTPVSSEFAPKVTAGPDLSVDRVTPILLKGSATDDVLLGPDLPVHWSAVSGPGTVEFQDASSPVTKAILSQPGTYVLRLTADDGTAAIADDVTVVQSEEASLLHLKIEHADGHVSEVEYTSADGTFLSSANDTELYFDYFGHGSTETWQGQFSVPEGRTVRQQSYRLKSPTLSPTLASRRGTLTLESDRGKKFQATDANSTLEIKRLGSAGSRAGVSCWIAFTIHAGGDVVTGEFRRLAPPNAGPHIELPEYTASFEELQHLRAVISDDGLPTGSHPTCRWTVMDSEDPVQIDSADQTETDVHLPGPGIHRMQLEVNDGETTSYGEIEVNLTPHGMRWLGWVSIPDRGPHGLIVIKEAAEGQVTGSLRIGGKTLVLKGQFDTEGKVTFPFKIGIESATLSLGPGDTARLAATVKIKGKSATALLIPQEPYRQGGTPNLAVGSHTYGVYRLEGTTGPSFGWAWGRFTVLPSGAVRIVLLLPDGSHSSGSTVFNYGRVIGLMMPQAHRADWFSFEAQMGAGQAWHGRAHWYRQRRGPLPAVDADLGITGTPQVAFPAPGALLPNARSSVTQAEVHIHMPGWSDVAVPMNIGPGGVTSRVGGGRLIASCKFSAGGSFSGFVIHPTLHVPISFSGVVLDYFAAGIGFGLSGARSGSISLVWPQ